MGPSRNDHFSSAAASLDLSSFSRRSASRFCRRLSRARKRRRVWTVAVLALALFAGAMTTMVFRVRSEAQRAQRETERAEKVAVFLAELFE